ncbi:MAG TPA: DUF1156 domain-containing protein [Planctomycetota bacterium]|nr:DUF1156 domain-containing protein [Planctomycetota bacterium]
MNTPKLLIEQWLPIAEIGAECTRDTSAAIHPPLHRLHVWWARRPLTVSRAAVLSSLLPAYPVGDDPDIRPWPGKFTKLFPSFDGYKSWFLRLIGIMGDPVAARKLLDWAVKRGKKISNPYGYPRALTVNPTEDQLRVLYDLLEWTWGTREITFCDPMAGGGSIPFEALRYGMTVYANELNPVASVILKATLDYPARFGPSLADDIRKYGKTWAERVRERLEPFYPLADQGLLLGRTVEFDPITDWYLMAWDAFSAEEFPADEARKLALALGIDLEKDIVREKKLVQKKSGTVVLNGAAARRKKGMVDAAAERFPHLIDALHTAMMIYDEEGSKACTAFIDRRGLRGDSRIKALVEAAMQAIPATRDKSGAFLRPELCTLDAMRLLFWPDLPAPKEEVEPVVGKQMEMFRMAEGKEGTEEEEQAEAGEVEESGDE